MLDGKSVEQDRSLEGGMKEIGLDQVSDGLETE